MGMSSHLWFWIISEAVAAPVGDPVANPSTGRLHVDAGLSMTRVSELDSKCSGDACRTNSNRKGFGLEAGIAILRGVGVYATAVRESDTVREAHYEGRMGTYGGGIRLALPLQPSFWIASTTDMRWGSSQSKQAERVDDPALATERKYSTSLLAVLGEPNNGGHLWLGAQATWLWEHTLHPLGSEGVVLEVPLQPKTPVSGVLGGTVMSDVIGAPWREAPRIRVSVEARAGQELGFRVTTGLTL